MTQFCHVPLKIDKMKNNISFVAQITDMDSGVIFLHLCRRVDPNQGVICSFQDVFKSVISYLEDGKSVSLEINFILSGFSDRNNQQLDIF